MLGSGLAGNAKGTMTKSWAFVSGRRLAQPEADRRAKYSPQIQCGFVAGTEFAFWEPSDE